MNPAAAVPAAPTDLTRFRVSRFALLSVDGLIRDYHFGLRIIVEHLPSGTRVSAARRAGVAPTAVLMKNQAYRSLRVFPAFDVVA
jgi:hypothetical protein